MAKLSYILLISFARKLVPSYNLEQCFFFGQEIAKKRDNLQMCKCDPLYYTASKLQDRSNAPKFSDDIASLWMNVPTLDE
jgi:hypothetical protein